MTEALLITARALAWCVAIAAWTFVFRYAVHTWWRTREGWNLMLVTLILALTFTLVGLMPWLAVTATTKYAIACIAYAAMFGVICQRIWLLSRSDATPPEED